MIRLIPFEMWAVKKDINVNILNLSVKKKRYNDILSGEIKIDYKEITEYWVRRIVGFKHEIEWAVFDEFITDLKFPSKRHYDLSNLLKFFDAYFKPFDAIEYRNGYGCGWDVYPPFRIKLNKITIDEDSRLDKSCFAFQLGKVLEVASIEK